MLFSVVAHIYNIFCCIVYVPTFDTENTAPTFLLRKVLYRNCRSHHYYQGNLELEYTGHSHHNKVHFIIMTLSLFFLWVGRLIFPLCATFNLTNFSFSFFGLFLRFLNHSQKIRISFCLGFFSAELYNDLVSPFR